MKKTLIAGLVLLGAAGMANANLINNGSFESSVVSGGYVTLGAGSSSLTDWKIDSGSIDLIGSYWQPAAGSQSLDMGGLDNGTISQVFATTVGQAYNVSFYVAGNPDGGSNIKSGQVSVGALTQGISFDTTGKSKTDMGWTLNSFSFVATSDSSKLSFAGTQVADAAYGFALDNVNVAAVPEPETYAMLLAGLGLMGTIARRRKGSKQA